MSHNKYTGELKKKRNYRPLVITLSIVLIGAIGILAGLPGYEDFDAFDVTILPLMNAIFNSFTFIFLVIALIAILNKKVRIHLGSFYNDFLIFNHLRYLPFLSTFYTFWRKWSNGNSVLLRVDYTYCFSGSNCSSSSNKYYTRLEW